MDGLSLEEENIIKYIRNLLRLEKETKAIKYRILRDIKNLLEYEEDYYKPLIVNNFRSKNYIEYKTKAHRKTLSVEDYLNQIKGNTQFTFLCKPQKALANVCLMEILKNTVVKKVIVCFYNLSEEN